jgi:hypothetical protein
MYFVFRNESMFHMFGTIDKQSAHVWGSDNPPACVDVTCNLPEVDFFVLFQDKGAWPFLLCRRLSLSFTLPAQWNTIPFPFVCESVSG